MRILHLDAGRELRGGQWQVLRLIEGLAQAGVESTLLARAGGPLLEKARQGGWRVEPLGIARSALLARRYDAVHAHDARAHTIAAIVRGAPLLVSRRVAFAIRSAWKYRVPDRYLAISECVRQVLIAGGVPENKIAVVYDGVPLLAESTGTAVIAPANAADPRKGAALAAEAARLAGIPLEFSDDLQRDLPRAGAFLYVTHAEGLGSGALLAMAAGVPVIASNIGGLPEIVRHGENGFLVENRAPEIADALRRIAADPAEARRMGRTGRQMVAERFTVEVMVRRTMEIYRQVLT